MAVQIPFTDNYSDLSTDRGFQFKFHCQRCGNGYMSSFQPSVTGMAGDALRAASGLFGGFLGKAADSAFDVQRMVGGPAHDAALHKAVEEISPLFHQCQRCGQWVCQSICWNDQRHQCVHCSPKMDQEISAIESEATINQLRSKAYNDPSMTGGVELHSAAAPIKCPSCGADVEAGKKFCAECGTNLMAKLTCSGCGVELKPGTKFCPECGTRAGA